jgi:prophage regulatory protein
MLRMIRLKPLLQRRKRSRSSHYADIHVGLYPPPIPLSPDGRSVAWLEHEDAAITAATVAGASAGQIKALVNDLVALRSAIPAGATDDEILALVRELVARTLADPHTAKAA